MELRLDFSMSSSQNGNRELFPRRISSYVCYCRTISHMNTTHAVVEGLLALAGGESWNSPAQVLLFFLGSVNTISECCVCNRLLAVLIVLLSTDVVRIMASRHATMKTGWDMLKLQFKLDKAKGEVLSLQSLCCVLTIVHTDSRTY